MEGHYSKAEVARILGCQIRTVNNHIRRGGLRSVQVGGKAWIPKEDVDLFKLEAHSKAGPSLDDHVVLQRRVSELEETVELLKAGLGFAARREPRTAAQMRLLFRDVMDHLGRPSWTKRMMSKFADDAFTLRESDIVTLMKEKGTSSLIPFIDLLRRMAANCEQHEEWPSKSLKLVQGQLIRAEDRLLGYLRVTSEHVEALERAKARRILDVVQTRQPGLDRFLMDYIVMELESEKFG